MTERSNHPLEHHVVMVSDASSATGLAITGYSALKRSSRPLHFWVVVDGINAAARRGLTECWSRTGNLAGVQFLPFGKLPIWFSASDFPAATYVRLLLTSIIPRDLGRYIYLDSDLLVGRDVCELLATDLEGCPIGMVPNDRMTDAVRDYVRDRLKLDPDDYYNGGVLLIDGDAFREEDHEAGLLEQCQQTAATWFADQDVLNSYFRGRIHRLETYWNLRDRATSVEGRILHYAGGQKPWELGPGPGMPVGEADWHDAFRESGFVPPPKAAGRDALQKLARRAVSKSLRVLLRLKHRLP